MNVKELAEIKARAEAATPGPWSDRYVIGDEGGGPKHRVTFRLLSGLTGDITGHCRRTPDAAFIAHAREDVPALVAEVERLRAALDILANVAYGAFRFDGAVFAETYVVEGMRDLARKALDGGK